jgi:hypothetical protein
MVRHVDSLPDGYRYAGTDTNRLGVVYVGPDYLPALPDPGHTPISADGYHCDACGKAVQITFGPSGSDIHHVTP